MRSFYITLIGLLLAGDLLAQAVCQRGSLRIELNTDFYTLHCFGKIYQSIPATAFDSNAKSISLVRQGGIDGFQFGWQTEKFIATNQFGDTLSCTRNVLVRFCQAAEIPKTEAASVLVYPNPTREEVLNIRLSGPDKVEALKLLSCEGSELYSLSSPEESVEIKLPSQGVFFVYLLYSGGGVSVKRVMRI